MSRVPALIVMHAALAAALLRAAATVYGPVDDVEVLSNQGLSRDQLEDEIGRRVEAWPDGGLVLTDFWGGSCHVCGAAAARGTAALNTSMLRRAISANGLAASAPAMASRNWLWLRCSASSDASRYCGTTACI